MKRYTRAYQVTVGSKTTVVHTENKSEAIGRAVKKLYGARCFWFADYGLPGYGQVFEELQPTKNNSNPGNSSVTYRVRLDVEPIGKPSRNFIRQQKQDELEWKRASDAADEDFHTDTECYMAGRQGMPFPYPDEPKPSRLWNSYYNGQEDTEHEKREAQSEIQHANDETPSENTEYDATTAARRRAEVDRLRSLPIETRCADERLQTIIRNTIAPSSFPTGLPLGDYKRRMLAGEYPEIVDEYLQSEKLFYRVNYID